MQSCEKPKLLVIPPAVVLVGWFRLTQWFLLPEVVPTKVAVLLQPHLAADGRVVPQFAGLGATMLRSSNGTPDTVTIVPQIPGKSGNRSWV